MFPQLFRTVSRKILTGTVALAISATGLFTASTVHAAPTHCNTPEAPPACTPGPPPPPTPPRTLESALFTPIPQQQNRVSIQMESVSGAAVSGYSIGDETRYRASVACSNGFFRSEPLAFIRIVGVNFLRLTVDLPGGDVGSCIVTTWDQSALGLRHASVIRNSPNGTLFTEWRVFFTP